MAPMALRTLGPHCSSPKAAHQDPERRCEGISFCDSSRLTAVGPYRGTRDERVGRIDDDGVPRLEAGHHLHFGSVVASDFDGHELSMAVTNDCNPQAFLTEEQRIGRHRESAHLSRQFQMDKRISPG